jgi:hypothetical protein
MVHKRARAQKLQMSGKPMQLSAPQNRFYEAARFEFQSMRGMAKIMVGVVVLAASFSPAMARIITFGAGPITAATNYPGAPRPVYDDGNISPYAMNYADEAAQTLGFSQGHLDLFTANPAPSQSYLPTFSGGLGGDGAMLKLQWHPGE